MKVTWQTPEPSPAPSKSSDPGGKNLIVQHIQVGHNFAEMYIRFDEAVVIMPPASIKKLAQDIGRAIADYEALHGKIKQPKQKKKKQESTAQKVVKALYKSRKISSNLISINTKRKKHLPLKDD